ncbi:MAG: methyltransferase, FkbM family domain protein [Ramlibacter sp.]|jgi:FkbM family methyltransferase|nr:methyltransferase, FkbM family domain protein [Ramlibacter sp.]
MFHPNRPIAYVLAATNHGSMIVNRNDQYEYKPGMGYGVGLQLLTQSAFDPVEVDLALGLLGLRKDNFGPGVVAVDGGANVGVHTIEWARQMHGWGRVLAFEAQEYVFYALAGNLAINNCWNASARWCALGETEGHIDIPEPDYLQAGSFGSLEVRKRQNTEFIGQEVSYAAEDCIRTPMTTIDAQQLERLDFFKLDVEGMEMEVLRGARNTLERCKPIVLVEIIKSDAAAIGAFFKSLGYETITEGMGLNMLAIHGSDPSRKQIHRVEA